MKINRSKMVVVFLLFVAAVFVVIYFDVCDREQAFDETDTAMIDLINATTDRRTLLSFAYRNEGDIKMRLIEPAEYAANCVALAEKLGFAITDAALKREYDKLLPLLGETEQ